jgi:hypothetical protein
MELRWDGVRSLADAMNIILVGGDVIHADQKHKDIAPPLPPPMPDWSPVRTFGGYQQRRIEAVSPMQFAAACGCGSACKVHGHAHAVYWAADAPSADAASFWGVMGCSCSAV